MSKINNTQCSETIKMISEIGLAAVNHNFYKESKQILDYFIFLNKKENNDNYRLIIASILIGLKDYSRAMSELNLIKNENKSSILLKKLILPHLIPEKNDIRRL